MEAVRVAISADFMTAFAALPRQIQGKVTEFINKFRNNPQSPGIRYEKISGGMDRKIWSVRIDDTYRGIVVRQPQTGVYLLLWVDHHDEAYAWARNKKCEVNAHTGAIQVYDVITTPVEVPAAQSDTLPVQDPAVQNDVGYAKEPGTSRTARSAGEPGVQSDARSAKEPGSTGTAPSADKSRAPETARSDRESAAQSDARSVKEPGTSGTVQSEWELAAPETALFARISDDVLTELGVPEDQLPFVRQIRDAQDFYAKQGSFSEDVYEALSWIAEDFPIDEVLELFRTQHEGQAPACDLAQALESPFTRKSFVVVEGEEELRRILAQPLEKWRIFLHPTQRKIVHKTYSGPARVLGGAGTGKTVVAMHRAKHLASALKGRERILFTTFTANLASDIRENLRKICTVEELRRIDVIHLDGWITQFLREHEYPATIIYDDRLDHLWEEAVTLSDPDGMFPVSFYQEEYNRVVAAQEAFTLEKYVKASRTGRGTRLDRKKRIQIWKVFEAYQDLMKERQVRDINTAMYECRLLLEKMPSEVRYRHVIVDEGQDLSSNACRLLRSIAGEVHENDLFIVGDAHQRIYKNKAVLSRCGINIRGRSSVLRINYRTTEEIRRAAFALLKGISFDDLDDFFDTGDRCRSLMHGPVPEVYAAANANEEFDALLARIRSLTDSGVAARDICIVARTHDLLDDYITGLTDNGIRCYEIRRSKADDRGLDGVRAATMHRVKGLEFQYVFIVAANHRIIPLAAAIDHTDRVSEHETMTAEKCLLYVALTRAQKGAFISGYGRMSEFTIKARSQ